MDQQALSIRMQNWVELVRECNESPLTKAEWCAQQGICEKTFYYWQKKLRKQMGDLINEAEAQSQHALVQVPLQTQASFEAVAVLHKGDVAIELSNRVSLELLENMSRLFHA